MHDVRGTVGFWDQQPVQPGFDHRGHVVERQAGIERVDAYEECPVTGRLAFEKLAHMTSSRCLLGRRHGVLEIEDQGVSA